MLILDAETQGGERAKVLDFGIAKLESGGLVRTRTNTLMGTPVYMAPEQCRGIKTIGERADVYALGVMLFEMMTERPPFYAEAPGDILGMHMFKPPPALSEFIRDCDPALNRMVSLMLAKDPQARPLMSEVAQTLKALGNLVSDVIPQRLMAELEIRSHERPSLAPPAVNARAPDPIGKTDPDPSYPRPGDASAWSFGIQGSGPAAPRRTEPAAPLHEPPTVSLKPVEARPAAHLSAEPANPSREPPTAPLKQLEVSPSLSARPMAAAERGGPSPPYAPPSLVPVRAAPPNEYTEHMTPLRLPVLPAILPPRQGEVEAAATEPTMKLRNVQQQQADYLQRKARGGQGPASLPPVEFGEEPSTKRMLRWTKSQQEEFQRSASQLKEPSMTLIFGGALALGLALVFIILMLFAR